jgi:hypothetical protein
MRGKRKARWIEGVRVQEEMPDPERAYSPLLPESTAMQIDLAISRLKRSGEVTQLRREALRPPGKQTIND